MTFCWVVFDGSLAIYVQNLEQDDEVFNLAVRLRLYDEDGSDEDVHEVTKTCNYNQWAAREILCERNYMEVLAHELECSPYVVKWWEPVFRSMRFHICVCRCL